MAVGSDVRIGVSPILWHNDDNPLFGADTSLEESLEQASRAGYAGIELGHKFPRQPEVLRDLLTQYGLELISGWYSAQVLARSASGELEAMAEHIDLLQRLGCELIVFGNVGGAVHRSPEPLSSRPCLDEESWPRFCAELDHVAKVLADRGMQLAYHHHMGTVIQSPEDVDRILNETSEAVGLVLDTGHFAYDQGSGDALEKFVSTYVERIVHVHLKDVRADVLERALATDMSFLEAVTAGVFTVPGDGSLTFRSTLQILKDARYRGWLVVEAEQDSSRAAPFEFAEKGYVAVQAWVEEVGL